MMKYSRFALGLMLWLSVGTLAHGQSPSKLCFPNNSGLSNCVTVSPSSPLPVTTSAPTGTQDINLKQVQGSVPSATNPIWVAPATASTPWAVSGTVAATQSGTWTVQPGNTANTSPWLTQLAGQSFTNIATSTDTVVKASAGTFVGLSVNTVGVTSTAVVYNNTTCTGAKIGTYSTTGQVALTVNAAASVGICVTTAGGSPADITVLWR